jgi:hypothetical protein
MPVKSEPVVVAIVCALAMAACAGPTHLPDAKPRVAMEAAPPPRPPVAEPPRPTEPERAAAVHTHEPARPPAARPEHGAPPAGELLEGFGAVTSGGTGGRVITVDEPTEAAVRAAFEDANRAGHAVIHFTTRETIPVVDKLPILSSPNLTIDGDGATLDGSEMKEGSAIVDIRTNDVIVRNLRLRNGDDNLRLQGPAAYRIAVTHLSSTGSNDDGISIGYGAHDVTVQWSFFAGNTRSVYCKYPGTNNISLHHTWIQKGAIRGPLFSGHLVADMRNVIVEDWAEWGSRFEDGASGNVVGSLFVLSPYAEQVGGKPHAALNLKSAGDVYTADNAGRGLSLPPSKGSASAPIPVASVRTQTAAAMEPVVRARAGCLPRDHVDASYVAMTSGWQTSETRPLRVSGSMPRVEKRE